MGKKTDKKFKSDRVNALRQQYDAFLEEDKKRKERNDYILGRLDNMRYTSTAVQIRHTIGHGDLVPAYSRVNYRPDEFERREVQITRPTQQISRTNHQNLQLDVPRKYLDDTSLLKEISKKYILIPKLRPSLSNDYVGTIPPQSLAPVSASLPKENISSNDDWKSKYDILEQLKNSEKEETTNKYGKEELFPVKEDHTLSKDNSKKFIDGGESNMDLNRYDLQKPINSYELQSNNTKDFSTKYEHEVPEKDLTSDKVRVESETHNLENSKTSDSKYEPSTDHTPVSSATYNIPEFNAVDDQDHTLLNQGLEHNLPTEVESILNKNNVEEHVQYNDYSKDQSEYTNTEDVTHANNDSEHQLNEDVQQGEYPVEYEQLVAEGETYPDPEKVYLDPDDYSPIEVLHPTELTIQINNEEFTPTETKEEEAVEYPVEMLNTQEFTPNPDVKLEDGVNVNPMYLASEETSEPAYETNPELGTGVERMEEPQESSGIDAFDAEQREMLYSEQTEVYDYDQQGDGNAQEYVATENYPQAQDNAFYDNTAGLQEQEYPVEINEHEESSRYDQNYEQQYATPYEQQEYDQGQQQYVPPVEGYEQPEQQFPHE